MDVPTFDDDKLIERLQELITYFSHSFTPNPYPIKAENDDVAIEPPQIEGLMRFLHIAQKELAMPSHSGNALHFYSVLLYAYKIRTHVRGIDQSFLSDNGNKGSKKLLPTQNKLRSGASDKIKVDIITHTGDVVRISSIRLDSWQREFAEMDADYIDSSSSAEGSKTSKSSKNRQRRDSVTNLALSLISRLNTGPSDSRNVTLVLSRITEESIKVEVDERIPQAIQDIRRMGVAVEFGLPKYETPEITNQNKQFEPTPRLVLDLSILIAIISQLSHDKDTQNTQVFNKQSSRFDEQTQASAEEHHSALLLQADIEFHCPIISALAGYELYTTHEASQRCVAIAQKVGGPQEVQRALAMFSDNVNCKQNFWRNSKFPQGKLHMPIRLLKDRHTLEGNMSMNRDSFTQQYASMLENLLSSFKPYDKFDPRVAILDAQKQIRNINLVSESQNQKGAIVKSSHQQIATTKATPHTLRTMLLSITQRYTYVTANRAAVKSLVTKIGPSHEMPSDALIVRVSELSEIQTQREQWLFSPRSLSESMAMNHTFQLSETEQKT